MIDVKRLRQDLADLGYILVGKNMREQIILDVEVIAIVDLVPTSPAEACWAFDLAIAQQLNEKQDEFKLALKERERSKT